MMWIKLISTLLWIVGIATVAVGDSTAEDDFIVELPGLEVQASFKQYSGYLTADSNRQFHYWLVESQSNPDEDPLIMWLNGGPGCSSVSGFLEENGPFSVNKDGRTLNVNTHSWNKNANVVYLESPAGVGYSYAPHNDTQTADYHNAENNYIAMQNFFEKYPSYAGRDFYITGESYAGVYVPLLADKVTGDDVMNLKGIAIGNGLLDLAFDLDSLPQMLHSHGMISTDLWVTLRSQCCLTAHAYGCSFTTSLADNGEVCDQLMQTVVDISWTSGVNPYNVVESCAGGADSVTEDAEMINRRSRLNYKFKRSNLRLLSKLASQVPVSQHLNNALYIRENENVEADEEEGINTCLNDTAITIYLNLPEVRQALHIPEHLPKWLICNNDITSSYGRQVSTVKPEILSLLKKNISVLIYNGDMDLACNVIGNGWFVDDLKLKREENHRPWFYNDAMGDPQVAGFVDSYENLDFVTFRGAGHFVPVDKPSLALHIINSFINGKYY